MKELLQDISKHNIVLEVVAGELKVYAGQTDIDPALIAEIRKYKPQLIQLLQGGNPSEAEPLVPKSASAESYPLSAAQQGVWMLSRTGEGSVAYNMPGVFRIEGPLETSRLEEAFNRVVQQYEILRTVFREDNKGAVKQYVAAPETLLSLIPITDLREEQDAASALTAGVQLLVDHEFDLAKGPLFRTGLFHLATDSWVLVVVMHHIICDGWSVGILMKQLMLFYDASVGNVNGPELQYRDFAMHQRQQLSSGAMEEQRLYWRQQLEGITVADLRGDKLRPLYRTYHGGSIKSHINKETFRAVKDICLEKKTTAFMGLVTIVNILLSRYTGEQDLVLGVPVSGRKQVQLESQIGLFAHVLPLRTVMADDQVFADVLQAVAGGVIEMYAHQDYPLEYIIDDLNISWERNRNPLFDIVVTFRDEELSQQQDSGALQVSACDIAIGQHQVKFDLVFNFLEKDGGVVLTLEYNSDVYTATFAEQLSGHFQQLLGSIAQTPAAPVARLDMIGKAEQQELLEVFNQTAAPYDIDNTVIALFETQVAQSPENILLVNDGRSFTYGEVNRLANQLASYLKIHHQLQEGDIAGIMLDRTEWMTTAVLSILKTGAAYLPIDPEYPEDRIRYMITDSRCKVVIDHHFIRQFEAGITKCSDTNPVRSLSSNTPAYVIYTSGSTGKPKGVVVGHRSLMNLCAWHIGTFAVTAQDKATLYASFSFDAAVWEFFPYIISGAALHLLAGDIRVKTAELSEYLSAHQITICFLPTGVGEQLIQHHNQPAGLRCLLLGGDKLNLFEARPYRIFNNYGPTECTVVATYTEVRQYEPNIPIGKPVFNTRILILDKHHQLCPVGVTGEICITGDALAIGYLYQEELTSQKFVPHPFHAGERMYKTGDLGCWRRDGNILFLGRTGQQVKVRGFRIEKGEIEHALLSHPSVTGGHVSVREQELVVYFTATEILSPVSLKDYLEKLLPLYMLPAYYVQLDTFPLTTNGKIDERRLPEPSQVAAGHQREMIAPRTESEQTLLEIWQKVLKHENISVTDNFFLTGGQSLKAARLISEVQEKLGLRLSLQEVFSYPVLEQQAALLNGKQHVTAEEKIIPVTDQENYPLSSSQERIWMASRTAAGSAAYHVPGVYLLEGIPDLAALQSAFDTLAARHEILRTVFRSDETGDIRQWVTSADNISVPVVYHAQYEGDEAQLKAAIALELARPFDLETGPLLRVNVFRKNEAAHIVVCVMHHIIADGWSVAVMNSETGMLYEAMLKGRSDFRLPPLPLQYRDFAAWQQRSLASGAMDGHRQYWMQQLGGGQVVLELPADRPRPPERTYNGDEHTFYLDAVVYRQLSELLRQQECTLFMGVLSAVAVLLYRYTGQPDMVLGTVTSGRELAGLQEQLGCYINTLALKISCGDDMDFNQLLQQVRNTTVGAYEHQQYPFDRLADDLQVRVDRGRNPLFDVMVILQDTVAGPRLHGMGGDVAISPYMEVANDASKVDLSFICIEKDQALEIALKYNTDIFDISTINGFARHLTHLLQQMVSHPATLLHQYDLLPPAEKDRLMTAFNKPVKRDQPEDSVIRMFERQADLTPGASALVFEDKHYTYKELNELANRLAHFLIREHRVEPGDKVAIIAERNDWSIISILGILKAGAAYVPVDTAFPAQRVAFIVEDSSSRVLLDETILNDFKEQTAFYPVSNPDVSVTADNLVYVIYTSGTTGRPKGVMISNAALTDYALGIRDKTNVAACRTFGLVSTIAADLGNTVIYTSLLLGGALHVYTVTAATDAEFMQRQQLDCLKITPSHWKALQEGGVFAPARCLIFGGEPLTVDMLQYLQQHHAACDVYNHYGPTETTIGKLVRRFDLSQPIETISLGWPIGDNQVYILDRYQQLLPEGAMGEICIAGRGLAEGYIHQPALTAGKFIDVAWCPRKLYRTGDQGRRLPDGSISFSGRKDEMLKIRGYSVEPEEIANTLQQCPGITKAVIIPVDNSRQEKELIAYVMASAPVTVGDMHAFLKERLPGYMVPAGFVRIGHIPLTPNGKTDKAALPAPTHIERLSEAAYIAPRNEAEIRLAGIWEKILSAGNIGATDDFFALGGHSLSINRLSAGIHEAFHVKVPLKVLFEKTILEEQAAFIQQSARGKFAHIPVQQNSSRYELSSPQQRLWLLTQTENSGAVYNMSRTWRLTGRLDTELLSKAFLLLLERHEILRTVFVHDAAEGRVQQEVRSPEATGFSLQVTDLRTAAMPAGNLQQLISDQQLKPFDPATGPLLRAAVYRLEEQQWLFIYTMHHIISDGWSMNVLFSELLLCYNALLQQQTPSLVPLRIQYKDYAIWQQQLLHSGALQQQQDYWLSQLSGGWLPLDIPADKPRPPVKSYNGGTISKTITPGASQAFSQLCQEKGTTLFAGLVTALNILLYKYSGQEDIVIGSPVAGREHVDLSEQIGFYVNTLALRTRLNKEDSFLSLLEKVSRDTVAANEHQAYPFDELVRKLNLKREPGRSPLFDVMITLQHQQEKLFNGVTGLQMSPWNDDTAMGSKFDLTFYFTASPHGIELTLEYNSDLFLKSTAVRMAGHLSQLLETVCARPELAIAGLDYLSAGEKEQLLTEFNKPAVDNAANTTLVALFEEQVRQCPNRVAVKFEAEVFSFDALNTAANRLARWLRENYDIRPDDLVAVQLKKGPQMIISLLGVLKSGAAYIPVGYDYPQERVDYILENSQCKILIDESLLAGIAEVLATMDANDLPQVNSPEDLAYVIYTSGSTGRPKGCMLEHRGVVNRLEWMWKAYHYHPDDVILQKTTYTFDVSVWEIFMPLCWGATMVLCGEEDNRDPYRILEIVKQQQVTCMHFVPSMLSSFMGVLEADPEQLTALRSLRLLVTSGEALLPETVRKWYRLAGRPLYNLYGPTEASIDVTAYATTAADTRIPIGKPVDNIQIHILDEAGQLVPVGIAGEICIAGIGVARGYLNNETLTRRSFSDDPFIPGNRMYHTGDIGRWLEDGNIEYIGRRDHQVKIRGYRIETGEIETALLSCEGVESVCVTDRVNSSGEKELLAYVVASLSEAALKQYLHKLLPAYMIPARFIRLERLPLTDSGKVNRRALPLPEDIAAPENNADYVAPATQTAILLAAIWEKLLQRERISATANFFDIGGSSLSVISLGGLIHKNFQVKISLRELFDTPVLEEQARLIQTSARDSFAGLSPVAIQPGYPLSSAQRRLWVLSQFDESSTAYHIPACFYITGEIDVRALQAAFEYVIGRHEILRTVFREDENTSVHQVVLPSQDISFQVALPEMCVSADELGPLIHNGIKQPFDLQSGPLLRASLYRFTAGDGILVFVMHHIISDGWSVDILLNELLEAYRGIREGKVLQMTALPVQYKDYASWQQEQLHNGLLEVSKNYWLERFSGELPVLELPAAKERPVVKTYHGSVVRHEVPGHVLEALRDSNGKGYTLFMKLLATLYALLYRYTGQEDMVIGCPVAGRGHADLEDQIGFYVNTLALRAQFSGSNGYRQLLEQVREITMGAYEHSIYPFDELVDSLDLQRDMSRSPLFDVLIILNKGNAGGSLQVPGATLTPYNSTTHAASKFDMSFVFSEKEDQLELLLEYNTDIYSHSQAVQMCHHWGYLMEAVVAQPDTPLGVLDYLPEKEKQQILEMCEGPVVPYPAETNLVTLFEQQVAASPDETALIFEETVLTYRALNDAAEDMSRYLHSRFHIQTGDNIGIKLERSEQAVIAMLAVLKAGAGCVPVDPRYPEQRVRYILEDSRCKALIDEDILSDFRPGMQYVAGPSSQGSQSSDIAYVVYTSGSTGNPKGCMLQHKGIVNHLWHKLALLQPQAGEALCHCSELYFVGGIWQLWAPLVTGGKVVLCNYEELRDMEKLLEMTRLHHCRILELIPSQVSDYLSYEPDIDLQHLRVLILTGEKLSVPLVERCYAGHPDLHIFNTYGQTECSDVTSFYEVPRGGRRMLVGKPVQHTRNYVLSAAGQLCPVGVSGEVCTSGDGVCPGYAGNAALTASRFVPDPFRPGRMMYKTGDLGRWLPDGNLEVLGRLDNQVKIRGYRIETGDIEHALCEYEGISEAKVLLLEGVTGEKSLVACLVSRTAADITDIRAYLERRLPLYMVPERYVRLERIPLLSNGKIDKRALAVSEGLTTTGTGPVRPMTPVETVLARLWKQLLGELALHPKSHFFGSGGHSLSAVRLMRLIHKTFSVKLSLKEIFEHPLLEQQAILVQRAGKTVYAALRQAPLAENYPLSSAQRRIWVLSQFDNAGAAYNMPGAYHISGMLDTSALEAAFGALIERHEILHTVFRETPQGEVRQYILPEPRFVLYQEDLRGATEAAVEQLVTAEALAPFDLATGPLLRVKLYRLSEQEWLLTCTLHHIITDGWSMGLLVNELWAFYKAFVTGTDNPLTTLELQYKDYAVWQQEQLAEGTLAASRAYWMQRLGGELPVLTLKDKPRPVVKTYHGAALEKEIPAETLQAMLQLDNGEQYTLFMKLLAAFHALLYRYTGQTDIITGTPVAGRDHNDLEGQIGFYVNTVALRAGISGASCYREMLEHTRHITTEAFEHAAYPFDELVDNLHVRRDMSRSPVFDVMIVLQNTDTRHAPLPDDLQITSFAHTPYLVSKFDLTLFFTTVDDKLKMLIEYNIDLFGEDTINSLGNHYISLLNGMLRLPDSPVQDINYLSEAEVVQLTQTFNDTASDHLEYRSVTALFEEKARTVPQQTALHYAGREITYEVLNNEANLLAAWITRKYPLKGNDLVAVLLERSDRLVIAMLAILKTGAAYVPMDTAYPAERINYILEDSQCSLCLDAALFDQFEQERSNLPVASVSIDRQPEELAYVMYTSGSTGLPKGCMVTNDNLQHYVRWASGYYFNGQAPHFGLFTSLSFDLTVTSIYCSLTSGGSLYIYPAEADLTTIFQHTFSKAGGINAIKLTPAHIGLLKYLTLPAEGPLCAIVGGEEVIPEHIAILKNIRPEIKIYNEYGPTETTVGCVVEELREGEPVRIGKPIDNMRMYVLDDNRQLCAVNVTGELYIGGKGVASGYLRRPELTAERFMADPFHEGGRIYKTGDLGRWLQDGTLDFAGRKDEQMKVQGYRIEPGEVENALRRCEGVLDAAVLASPDSQGTKELAAWIVTTAVPDIAMLRSSLGEHLPAYMIPTAYYRIDQIPLTPNGKVDRKRLLAERSWQITPPLSTELPADKIEEMLLEISREIFANTQMSVKDNFFDAGANSIKLIRLLKQINTQFNTALTAVDIFTRPTVSGLATLLRREEVDTAETVLQEAREASDILEETMRHLNLFNDDEN
ncbi:amino acid adenylation domain-containing protein [Chitinophaga sp. G-6-1-13]|uniref:Amino acid adenylation domain-containing protein n=1 Tax=Chitinophaga fulva TaxID=2728842 RepID=A0A848GM19_9BACT|nr:non-ribosomal peptide synthetase [Chitinophaga fulva]NML37853.1 amino acid adenylation domain-containing protein [Chitinophaga fulva]